MRRVLSLTLALLMAVTCLTGISLVSVSADEGQAGQITVWENNFENGKETFSDFGASKTDVEEENGNKYLAVTSGHTAEQLITMYCGDGEKDPNKRIGIEIMNYAFNAKYTDGIPLKEGSKYCLTFNAKTADGSTPTFGQTIPRVDGNQQWPNTDLVGDAEGKPGWKAYKTATPLTVAEGGSNLTDAYVRTDIGKLYAKVMADTKTYAGKGLGNTASEYTFEIDGTQYSLKDDCTEVGDTKEVKLARFQQYLDENPIKYCIDDYKWVTDTVYYTDTVTVTGAEAEVTALTNPATNETAAVKNGETVTVNDYFGTTYTVKANGAGIKSAKYNGEAVDAVNNGESFEIKIAADKVVKNGTLEIELDASSIPIGRKGKVSVYKADFESGDFGWSYNKFATSSIKEDNGNKYFAISDFDAEKISAATGNTAKELFSFRCDNGVKINYLNGKSYDYTMKASLIRNGKKGEVNLDLLAINGMTGGYLLGYSGGKPQKISQWYGGGATGKSDNTLKAVSSYDEATGWTTKGYTGISYRVWDGNDESSADSMESATVDGLFIKWKYGDMVEKLLVDNKAYSGKGIKNSGSKFTITEADLYGDEEGLAAGKTKADLCKEWSLAEDCTALKSAKRTAAFQAALDSIGHIIAVDDIEFNAEAYFEEIPVNITGSADVEIVTNTYTGEKTNLTSSGKVTANDYYGMTVTVKAAGGENDSIASVKFDGKDIPFEGLKETTFTIPGKDIKQASLDIAVDTVSPTTPFIKNARIEGEGKVGATAEVKYDYVSTVADASTYKWQVLDGETWRDIEGASSKTYTIKTGDNGKSIRAVVSAKNANGETWRDVTTDGFYIGEVAFYVATNGKDTNDGSEAAPFATLKAAKEAVKAFKEKGSLPNGEVTVYIKG